MEHKVNDIITYNHNGETIYLKVIEDFNCKNCFFQSTACCSDIRNNVGDCLSIRRTDKTPVIFKKVNNKIMNENIDLTEILKNCPSGTPLYSVDNGYVTFSKVDKENGFYQIIVEIENSNILGYYTKTGKTNIFNGSECCLFPSKEQRDWSKFTAPWYKKEKFDPKTLKPFDKVLVRDDNKDKWFCEFFSHKLGANIFRYICISGGYKQCIPYNDNTKHLVGTKDEAPEYYRYWEE